MLQENDIQTVFLEIQNRISSQGQDLETTCSVLQAQYGHLIPGYEDLLAAAVARYKKEQDRIEFIRVPAMPRRRHEPWYGGSTQGGLWEQLHNYLLNEKDDFSKGAIESIDESSTKVISLLDNPGRPKFSTRSLVVGYVQSGKTANMTAVIAKAADAGYRFIIVLAGLTNALRKQTEERLDEDLYERTRSRWSRYTTIEHDFGYPTGNGFQNITPQNRAIAVVKKNSNVLQRILDMLDNTDEAYLRNTPFLIIDDECDQASVNAARYRNQITAINGRIRQIFDYLPKSAYIGYTATPFANVLIDPAIDPNNPKDLYPSDFIVSLPKPEGYFGTEELFGRTLIDAGDEDEEDDGHDMIRGIPDTEVPFLRATSANRDTFSLSISKSLEDAICYYLLATAARFARGHEGKPSCMLIHTSVRIIHHSNAASTITKFLDNLTTEIRTRVPRTEDYLRELWQEEHPKVPSSDFALTPVSYDDLRLHLEVVTESVKIKIENSQSTDRLDFDRQGTHHYIVVGGNVLARGLTIKGLVVSFFLRTSSQYDSLMQMGRWFGYRFGYQDLPRVWMSKGMRDAFKDLAAVEAEIREEISKYIDDESTPLDFAVRIRKIPGMAITAKNKMLAGRDCNISYSNEHIQTTRFYHKDSAWLEGNWNIGVNLINQAIDGGGEIRQMRNGRVIFDVNPAAVNEFIRSYNVHPTHKKFSEEKILDYIEKQNAHTESALTKWNVGIIETANGRPSESPLSQLGPVNTIQRSLFWETEDGAADIKALMSKQDVIIDTSGIAYEGKWDDVKSRRQGQVGIRPLLLLYVINKNSEPKNKDSKDRHDLKAVNDILAAAFVFPESPRDTPVYVQVELPEMEDPDLPDFEEQESDLPEAGIEC